MRRVGLGLVVFLLVSGLDAPNVRAQSYLQNVGVPSFTASLPVENGFINLANGNLHLEIPLGSFAQRGGGTDKLVLMYDSAIWTPVARTWSPTNIYGASTGANAPWGEGGWRLVTSGDAGNTNSGYYESGWCAQDDDYAIEVNTPWIWTAPDGTQHSFPASTFDSLYPGDCPDGDKPNAAAYASDGSGYYISITNYTDATVYSPDGTIEGSGVQTDPNGNQYTTDYVSSSPFDAQFIDTLGRTVVQVTESSDGSALYYAVPKPGGGTNTYTVKLTTVWVNTNFGQSGIAEYSSWFTAVSEIDLPDGTAYYFGYNSGTSPGYYGLLTSMTLPTGGQISYSYSNFTDAYGNVSHWVTHRTTPDSSTGWSYSPYVILSCTSGEVNCTQIVNVQSPSGNNDDYTFTLNGGSWATGVQYSDASNNVPASTLVCYSFMSYSAGSCSANLTTASPATNVYKIAQTDTLYGSSGNVSKTTQYTWDPANIGNITQMQEWNFGNSPSNAADRTTTISYYSNGYVINKPAVVTVYDGSGNKASQTTNGYDAGSSCACGNLTSVAGWLNTGSSNPTTYYTYTGYGMPATMKDPNGNTTTYNYDGTGAYLSSIQYPTPSSGVQQIESFSFDSNTGVLLAYKDRNGQQTGLQTTYSYDDIGRLQNINYPDGGQSIYAYDSGTQYHIDQKVDMSGTLKTTYFQTDILGRSDRVAVSNGEAAPFNWDETANICFDADGRVGFEGYPFQDSGWGNAKSCSLAGDQFKYDGLNRLTAVTHSDGSAITYWFNINCVTSFDESGNPRGECYDYRNRLTQVWEDQPGFNYPTFYGYDVLDDLTSVTQNNSRNRTFVYDSLGRMTSETNLESGSDYYYYDLNSNVVTKVTPNATTYLSYDALNRLASKSYSDTGTPTVNLGYDNPNAWGRTLTNTIGRLVTTSTVDSNGHGQGEVFSYDSMGRVLRDEQCIYTGINGCMTAYASYNFLGSLASFTNVQGTTFSYAYNAGNRETALTSSLSGAGYPGTLISGLHYTALAQPATDALGNGEYEYYGYASRGWVDAYWACQVQGPNCSPSQLVYGFNMTPSGGGLGYAPSGNITYAGDTVNGNWTYGYDALNRLNSANCSNTTAICPGSQTSLGLQFVYDEWGNRSQQNVTAGSGPSMQEGFTASNNNRMDNYSYDGAGNLLDDGYHSYAYDDENRIVSIDNGASAYTYDAFGRRVSKTTSAGTVDYFYDVLGRQSVVTQPSTSPVRQEIYAADRHLGTYTNGSTYFSHVDWLGTERVRTDVNENAVETCQNTLFGDFLSCTNTDIGPLHFTAQERDPESAPSMVPNGGLDNFPARHYSSQLGRFMSPDPTGIGLADLTDPQQLNLYSYVRGNPLRFIDPNGTNSGDEDACNQWDGCGPPTTTLPPCGPGVICVTTNQGIPPFSDNDFSTLPIWGISSFGGSSPRSMLSPAAPSPKTTTCAGPSTVSAVGTGKHQAPYTGHTGSLYPPIPGGAMGTVAVQNNFLGIGRAELRQYGTQIHISFADNGAIVASGGPAGPYTVSDRGDVHIQEDPSVRFDLYRWDSTADAFKFGIQRYPGDVTFPTGSGGTCPSGWTVQ